MGLAVPGVRRSGRGVARETDPGISENTGCISVLDRPWWEGQEGARGRVPAGVAVAVAVAWLGRRRPLCIRSVRRVPEKGWVCGWGQRGLGDGV